MMTSIPQPELLNQLGGRFSSDKLPPSMLFSGRKGVGKWSTAFALARRITCLQPGENCCGVCASCRQAERFDHPDIHYLFPLPKEEKDWDKVYLPYLQAKQEFPFADAPTAATQFIPIEAIRVFQNKLALRPSLSAAKVGIIYEAERMLPGTMDSLLKLLEEPPPHTYLIVITDQPRILHATILSRLQKIPFPPLAPDFITAYLRDKLQAPEDKIPLITRFAGGTLYNIEAIVAGGFFELRDSAFAILRSALQLSPPELLIKHGESEHLSSRAGVEKLLGHWQNFLRDFMIIGHGGADQSGTSSAQLLNYDYHDRYAEFTDRFPDLAFIEKQIEKIEQVKSELRRNVNPRMAAFSFLAGLGSPVTATTKMTHP